MKFREKLARWLWPRVFEENLHLSGDLYLVRLELDFQRVCARAAQEGRRVPIVQTIGELKSILPAGVMVDESFPGLIKLAYTFPPVPDINERIR